jgi:hypothetical protein
VNEIPLCANPVGGIQVVGLVMDILVNGTELLIKRIVSLTGYMSYKNRPFGIRAENILQTMDLYP